MTYWNNFKKPEGVIGKIVLKRMSLQHKVKVKWVLTLINMEKSCTLLDIGCGEGGFINYAIKKNTNIKAYGLDYSDVSVKAAKKRNKKYIPFRCEIIEGSVSHIPLDTESIDLVTSFSAIYYWPHIKEDFAEVYRVLSFGGMIAIDCTLFEFVNTDIGYDYEKKIPGFKLYEVNNILHILENIGFKNIQIHREKHPLRICITADKL